MADQIRFQVSPEFVKDVGEYQISIMYNQLGEQIKKLQSMIRTISNSFDESFSKIDELKKENEKIKKEFDEMLENLPLAADFIAQNEGFLKLDRKEQSKIISELIWSNILHLKKLNDYTNDRYEFYINKIIKNNEQKTIDDYESIEPMPLNSHINPEKFFEELKNKDKNDGKDKIEELEIDFL